MAKVIGIYKIAPGGEWLGGALGTPVEESRFFDDGCSIRIMCTNIYN